MDEQMRRIFHVAVGVIARDTTLGDMAGDRTTGIGSIIAMILDTMSQDRRGDEMINGLVIAIEANHYDDLADFCIKLIVISSDMLKTVGIARAERPTIPVFAAMCAKGLGFELIGSPDTPEDCDGEAEVTLASTLCAAGGGCGSMQWATAYVAGRFVSYGSIAELAVLNRMVAGLFANRPDIAFSLYLFGAEITMLNNAHGSAAAASIPAMPQAPSDANPPPRDGLN